MKRIISIFLLTTVIVSLLASCSGQESTLIDFLSMDDERQLLCFCYTDIHNQQAMLDYPTTVRRSLILATELARDEFGLADMAIVGGDNISDYPYWDRSCALPKKNFLDLKQKLNGYVSDSVTDGKVIYVTGNNDMIMGDIGTAENDPYNATDFYDYMESSLGVLPENEKTIMFSEQKPNETYWGAFHYVVNGIDFIGINIDPNTAYNSHDGYYSNETMIWVKDKLNEIDPDGTKPVFVVGHLSAIYINSKGALEDTIVGTDKELFYSMFNGHKNVFYLYGHLHGEDYCYEDYSSGAVLHLNEDNLPISDNRNETDNVGKEYSYTLVHMGGLRPFGSEYFLDDGISGYGGESEISFYGKTGTPTLAQYMIFEVYENRVVFHIRNTGSRINYTTEDVLKPYTVYFQK